MTFLESDLQVDVSVLFEGTPLLVGFKGEPKRSSKTRFLSG